MQFTDTIEAHYLLSIQEKEVSLYFHIPFCKTMCLFCACSVILNRDPERQIAYVKALCREIRLLAEKLPSRKTITQLHFGGGTPTLLTPKELEKIFSTLFAYFDIAKDIEMSIEIDPRTVTEEKLTFLKNIGFNRVSFGVQDIQADVQEAVKRRQTWEMTSLTYRWAREIFSSIHIDLIYGLPLQTPESFQETIGKIAGLRPDRLSLFSYAKVPWLKPHQKAIKDRDLPSTFAKFQIYLQARNHLIASGYEAIGMDHFSLKTDELSIAYQKGILCRNFQGYSVKKAKYLLGLGVTAISLLPDLYVQNEKGLEGYREAIQKNRLPLFRGKKLSEEDKIRRDIIHTLMCDFSLDTEKFPTFPFAEIVLDPRLAYFENKRLMTTELGKLFIRHVASYFDAYLQKEGAYSKGI